MMVRPVSSASLRIRNLVLSHSELRLPRRRNRHHVVPHKPLRHGTYTAKLGTTDLMSRAWSTCPQPIKSLTRRLEAARGSAAPVPVASAAGPVNLSAALVLRKIMGDTHAAALLKTLEGGSKPESSVKAMLTKRAKEAEKLKLSEFTA